MRDIKMRWRMGVGTVFLCAAALCGCGAGEENNTKNTQPIASEGAFSESAAEDVYGGVSGILQGNAGDFAREWLSVEQNREEATFVVEGDKVHFAAASAADGERLYLCQRSDYDEAGLYGLDLADGQVERLPFAVPQGMDIAQMAVDCYGDLYVLLSSGRTALQNGEKARYEIWLLDEGYQALHTWNVTDAMGGMAMMPYDFYVLEDGSFYVQWGVNQFKAILLNPEGELLCQMNTETLGIDSLMAAGLGWDGGLCMIVRQKDTVQIAFLDEERGLLSEEAYTLPVSVEEHFMALASGGKGEMLLYSGESGIWRYDADAAAVSCVKRMSEGSLPYDTTMLLRTFLPDGRLLLVENITEDNTLARRQFRLIPPQ